jgi:glutaredoxin-related protein
MSERTSRIAHAARRCSEEAGSCSRIYHGDELTMLGVRAASGAATLPQVFLGGQLLGGADQLTEYLSTH